MIFTGYSRNVGTKVTLAEVMDIAALWRVAPEDVVIQWEGDHIEVSYTVPVYTDADGWDELGCMLCRKIGHDPSEPCQP